MARTGYTNLRPTPERDRMFADIAATQGMDPATHKHRVEMIDQGLRLLAQKARRGTMNEYYECTNCGQVVQGFVASQMIQCCDAPGYHFRPIAGPEWEERERKEAAIRSDAAHADNDGVNTLGDSVISLIDGTWYVADNGESVTCRNLDDVVRIVLENNV